MEDLIYQLLEKTYHLNMPMPVVSVTELVLHVPKDTIYFDRLEIYNSSEGYITGMVDTINNIIQIKNRFIKGNHCIVEYEVAKGLNASIDPYVDTIIITYNGGEILVPVTVYIIEEEPKSITVRYVPKQIPKYLKIETDQKSYHSEDTGLLKFYNPTNKKLSVKIDNLDGYIFLKETEFELNDYKQVEFNFKITKLDKILGKIPLKTNPKIELPLQIQVRESDDCQEYSYSIFLTELQSLQSKVSISSQKVYQQLFTKLYNEYSNAILYGTKSKLTESYMDQFKALINFDKTNIDLRLFYCYLAIEFNKKDWALREINNIDRFLLYYDNECLEVSDLLLLYIEIIKGESVQELVSRWYPSYDKTWLKILLKNRLMTHNHSSYSDYKALFIMGIRNRLLYTESVQMLNSSPLIPLSEDCFYKAMLTWAIRKKAIGLRWQKKLENNYDLLLQNNNLNAYIAEQLYLLDSNKSMLSLLCAFYLHTNCYDEKAFVIYERAIIEKTRLEGLDIAYIKAAYNCRYLLDISCLKMSVKIDNLKEHDKAFFLLNILINKETYKHIYYYYAKAIDEMKPACFKEYLVPEVLEEKMIYIDYLLNTYQYDCIIGLYNHSKLNDLDEATMAMIARGLYESHPELAVKIARRIFQSGSTHQWIIQIISLDFKGSLDQLMSFYDVLKDSGRPSVHIQEEILLKGILTRKHPDEIMEIYVEYYNQTKEAPSINGGNSDIDQLAQHYIAAQIIIEEIQPSYQVIQLLERIVEKEENIPLYLALLKSYIKSNYKKELIINRLIKELVSKGIVFSWYLQLVPKSLLGERLRIQQFFEYNSQPNRTLFFNYRLDDDVKYSKVAMKHVALGLYIVNVIMFYNEGIQYYIEESNLEGGSDIKSSDLFIKKDLIEQDDTETLFDLINTIEISKEMNDVLSMEKTVAHYIMMCNKEIDKMNIL